MGSPEMGSPEKSYLWDFQPRPLSVIYPAVKLDASLDAIQLQNSPRCPALAEPYKATLAHQRVHCPANACFVSQVAIRPQLRPATKLIQNLPQIE